MNALECSAALAIGAALLRSWWRDLLRARRRKRSRYGVGRRLAWWSWNVVDGLLAAAVLLGVLGLVHGVAVRLGVTP